MNAERRIAAEHHQGVHRRGLDQTADAFAGLAGTVESGGSGVIVEVPPATDEAALGPSEGDLRERSRVQAAIDHEAPWQVREGTDFPAAQRGDALRQRPREGGWSRGEGRRIHSRDSARGGQHIGARLSIQHRSGNATQ